MIVSGTQLSDTTTLSCKTGFVKEQLLLALPVNWETELESYTIGLLMVIFPLLLVVPVIAGFEPTTRIKYPVPSAVPVGMVAAMFPEVVLDSVPIFKGEAKEPEASDN